MKKPQVTIAIPTFNRADKFLGQALESAINQTYQNLEILISDNCSTDHTEEVVRSYSDPRIKYFRQKKNLGKQGNANFLLKMAKGDYFHLFHDDDHIEPDFVEVCMKRAKFKSGIGVIMSGSKMIDENGAAIQWEKNYFEGLSLEEFILNWYHCKVNVFLCCTLFGTKTLREIGGFEEKYNLYDDVAANFKCTQVAGRLDIPEIKASLRSHSGSVTSSADLEAWSRDALALLELACSLAPGKKKEIQKIGMQQSAKNVYMFANERESRVERLKCSWKVFKTFGYRYPPPLKHCNQIIPISGYVLHPYKTISKIKSTLLHSLRKAVTE